MFSIFLCIYTILITFTIIYIIIFIIIKSMKHRRVKKTPEPRSAPYIIHSSDPETERRDREIAELRILLEKERRERADLARQVENLKHAKPDGGGNDA